MERLGREPGTLRHFADGLPQTLPIAVERLTLCGYKALVVLRMYRRVCRAAFLRSAALAINAGFALYFGIPARVHIR